MTTRRAGRTDPVFELAEGPVWDAPRERLLWVDILAGTVLRGRASARRGRGHAIGTSSTRTSARRPSPRTATLLVAERQRPAPSSRPTAPRTPGPDRVRRPPGRPAATTARCDPAGGSWSAPSSLTGGPALASALVRVDGDDGLTVLDDDLRLVQRPGLVARRLAALQRRQRPEPAWSGCATTTRRPGDVGPRRLRCDSTTACPTACALDADGNLWLAVWGAGEVRCYSPGRRAGRRRRACRPAHHEPRLRRPRPRPAAHHHRPRRARRRQQLSPSRLGPPLPRPTPAAPASPCRPGPAPTPTTQETTMQLMRIGPVGAERPVVRVDDTTYVDVSDVVDDFDEALLRRRRSRRAARRSSPSAPRPDDVAPFGDERIGAPIARPHQILCIGLNYSDHAAETGQAVPDEPILFTKSPNTLVGPNDDVRHPARLDQARLGGRARHRDRPARQLPRTRSRRPATRSPASCWSTTSASAPSRWSAAASGRRASRPRRSTRPGRGWSRRTRSTTCWRWACGSTSTASAARPGRTSTMVFDPYFIVHHLSQFMVLEPGDLINTGTPPGRRHGLRPAGLAAARRRDGARHRRASAPSARP